MMLFGSVLRTFECCVWFWEVETIGAAVEQPKLWRHSGLTGCRANPENMGRQESLNITRDSICSI